MTTQFGITITSITMVLCLVFLVIGIVSRNFIYLKLNTKLKRMSANIAKMFVGIVGLVYFLMVRYVPDVQRLINQGYGYLGIYYSKVWLLDLCPFIFIVLMLLLIFDYNSKITNIFSIWALIGASVTIFGGGWGLDPSGDILKYIFIGGKEGRLYFLFHFYMLIIAFYYLGASNRYRFVQFISTHIFISLYLIYVIIVVKSLNIQTNATGLVEFDWLPGGEYDKIAVIFNVSYPGVMFLSYFLLWLLLILLITIKNFCHKPKLYAFWPKKLYDKSKWLSNLSLRFYKFKCKVFRIVPNEQQDDCNLIEKNISNM